MMPAAGIALAAPAGSRGNPRSSALVDDTRGGSGCANDDQQSQVIRVIRTLITRLRRRGSDACGRGLVPDADHASRNVAAIATPASSDGWRAILLDDCRPRAPRSRRRPARVEIRA